MISSVSFLVVASAAVFTITMIRIKCPMIRKHPENNDSNIDSEEAEQNLKKTKMDKRRDKLEVKLLEMYCLKQQHMDEGDHLRQILKSKFLEIDMLNATKVALQFDKERLKEKINQNQLAENQLDSARASLKAIQGQECVESAKLKGQLLMLKEQLSEFGIDEKRESLELKEKLIATKNVELELEAMEWNRKKKELQLDMRELGVKLVAAQTSIMSFPRFSESHIIGELEAERRRLRHSNEVFLDNIEKLQMNRFDMVQELVYQRWLNACLKFEIHESQTPQNQNRNMLSFESQEASSIFSVESDETTGTTATSYSSSQTSAWRRYNIAQKLRNWGRIKKRPDQRGLIRRFSMSSVLSSGPTRAKNVVTNSPDADNIKRLRRVSFSDSVRPSKMEVQDTRRSMSKEGNTKAMTGNTAIRKGILRRFSMSSVPSDASSTPVRNQVLDFSESSKLRRTKRVSLDDLLKQEPLAFCNVTKHMDDYSDHEEISSKIYTSGSDLDMKNIQEISSRSLYKKQDETGTQVASKSETLNAGLNETKYSDQLMDVATAAVIIVFFILLVFLFFSSICH
ncbi:hypothetical protein POM88_021753 [Heracleum sosnowskyi]|uniref:Protein CHUP1, chloroplastic n=1 Tax=Heracleum sosnowskyi TaxID=360622 RepID=A0AAD8MU39_9APIA|nr:hypothetical protein POM88_021753 [Heracleum sosnowskyi]